MSTAIEDMSIRYRANEANQASQPGALDTKGKQ